MKYVLAACLLVILVSIRSSSHVGADPTYEQICTANQSAIADLMSSCALNYTVDQTSTTGTRVRVLHEAITLAYSELGSDPLNNHWFKMTRIPIVVSETVNGVQLPDAQFSPGRKETEIFSWDGTTATVKEGIRIQENGMLSGSEITNQYRRVQAEFYGSSGLCRLILPISAPTMTVGSLYSAVSGGTPTITGRETIGGNSCYVIEQNYTLTLTDETASFHEVFRSWVNSDSYLVVRATVQITGRTGFPSTFTQSVKNATYEQHSSVWVPTTMVLNEYVVNPADNTASILTLDESVTVDAAHAVIHPTLTQSSFAVPKNSGDWVTNGLGVTYQVP